MKDIDCVGQCPECGDDLEVPWGCACGWSQMRDLSNADFRRWMMKKIERLKGDALFQERLAEAIKKNKDLMERLKDA